MYVEASTRGEGQTAHLISPKYQGMAEQCVEFYYHMYGRDIGTLNVYTQVGGFVNFQGSKTAFIMKMTSLDHPEDHVDPLVDKFTHGHLWQLCT